MKSQRQNYTLGYATLKQKSNSTRKNKCTYINWVPLLVCMLLLLFCIKDNLSLMTNVGEVHRIVITYLSYYLFVMPHELLFYKNISQYGKIPVYSIQNFRVGNINKDVCSKFYFTDI